MTENLAANRDYTLIIDASTSMETADCQGLTRWKAAQEGTVGFARKAAELDPDGITVYRFASSFKRYDDVKPEQVEQIFTEQPPWGSTNLALVLSDALKNWKERKTQGTLKAGDTIVVVTDGAPDDPVAVKKLIAETTQSMDADEELAILFLQIGSNPGAADFLEELDDDLVEKFKAKFDAVDTKTFVDIEKIGILEALKQAITD